MNVKTERLHLRLSEDDYAVLRHKADEADMPYSIFLEKLIEDSYSDYIDGVGVICNGRSKYEDLDRNSVKSVNIRVTPEINEKLNELAFYCSDSKSGVVRKLLQD